MPLLQDTLTEMEQDLLSSISMQEVVIWYFQLRGLCHRQKLIWNAHAHNEIE